MYTIKCDGYPLLDYRDEALILANPRVDLELNTVGSGSFTIYRNHPYYDRLQPLRSEFEIADDFGVIFRGRMTSDTVDFCNRKTVDLEGAMAYFNDSMVRPYAFPEDLLENEYYIEAAKNGNVVEFFLRWLIDMHNAQVQPFQQFKLGVVTVSDPNNYITRSDTNYAKTWDVLKSKLFESSLGGYLCIRYEEDGNYIDYLSAFEGVNTQRIEFGENLLDRMQETDAAAAFSAILPLGAALETSTSSKARLTLDSIEDGDITEDIVKRNDTLYSKSAVDACGWIYAPIADTTWQDVTQVQNLLTKAAEMLVGNASQFAMSEDITAVDLHLTDREIMSLRLYKDVYVKRGPHDVFTREQLRKMSIDIQNLQNTKIAVGATRKSLTDSDYQLQASVKERIQELTEGVESSKTEVTKKLSEIDSGIAETQSSLAEVQKTAEAAAEEAAAAKTKISALADDITAIKSALNELQAEHSDTLLYENEEPQVEMGETELSIDLSAYSRYRIVFLDAQGTAEVVMNREDMYLSGDTYQVMICAGIWSRTISISSSFNGAKVGECRNMAAETVDNSRVIPHRIYGYS